MTQITDHLAEIRERVANAAAAAERDPSDVTIVAVSKQQPVTTIEAAWHAGQRHFAESYLQEALPKIRALEKLDIQWHFIGRIQSNKTRAIAESFDWVHTIDRPKVAGRLDDQRPRDRAPLKVFLQVNQGGERQKGDTDEANVEALVDAVAALEHLELAGLMSIPPRATPAETGAYFERLGALRDRLAAAGRDVTGLSMGMTEDFETAITHGATCVRIGTGIFGPRMRR